MKDIRKEKVPGSNPGVGSKFNSNICLHLLGDFPPQKCARKCSSAHDGSGREASGRRRSMHPQRGACSESIKSARAARPADRPVTPTQPPS